MQDRSFIAVLAGMALAIALAPGARAQAPDDVDDAAVAQAPLPADDAEARARFEAGRIAFGQGRYESALEDFRRAHDLTGRSELLYNIGSAADRLRLDGEALEAFEAYLAAVQESPVHPEVRRRVAVLREMLERGERETEDGAATEPVADAPPEGGGAPAQDAATSPRMDSGGRSTLGPWLTLGAASLLMTVGVALGAVGVRKMNNWQDPPQGSRWSEVQDGHARGARLSAAGWAVAGLGVGGLSGAILWLLRGGRAEEEPATRVEVGPLSIGVRGRF
jgi:tetratricopeptide (TPR) repeat protein